jgi:hypothetical protein
VSFGRFLARILVVAFIAGLVAGLSGCASSSGGAKVEVTDQSQKGRVMEAIAEAERLAGRRLPSDVSVNFAPGEKLLSVRDLYNRPRKVWTKRINDGYRAASSYRGHITIFTKPGSPHVWDFDVLVHEVGHSIHGRGKEEDHRLMKEAGFAF